MNTNLEQIGGGQGLIEAITLQDVELVKRKLSGNTTASEKLQGHNMRGKPSDPNTIDVKTKYSALMYAIHYRNIPIIKLLLSKPEININYTINSPFENERKTALLMAIQDNNDIIIELLLSYPKIDVYNYFYNIFVNAINKNNNKIIELLLSKEKININYIDIKFQYENEKINYNYLKTALMIAIERGNDKIVELLLSHPSIDINIQGMTKNNALMIAIEKGNNKIVELLLSKPSIDINLKNSNNKTALMIALEKKNEKIINMLWSKTSPEFYLIEFLLNCMEENDNSDNFYYTRLISLITPKNINTLNKYNHSLLDICISKNKEEAIIKKVLEYNPDTSSIILSKNFNTIKFIINYFINSQKIDNIKKIFFLIRFSKLSELDKNELFEKALNNDFIIKNIDQNTLKNTANEINAVQNTKNKIRSLKMFEQKYLKYKQKYITLKKQGFSH
jgi:ankyrin repeat protein